MKQSIFYTPNAGETIKIKKEKEKKNSQTNLN